MYVLSSSSLRYDSLKLSFKRSSIFFSIICNSSSIRDFSSSRSPILSCRGPILSCRDCRSSSPLGRDCRSSSSSGRCSNASCRNCPKSYCRNCPILSCIRLSDRYLNLSSSLSSSLYCRCSNTR